MGARRLVDFRCVFLIATALYVSWYLRRRLRGDVFAYQRAYQKVSVAIRQMLAVERVGKEI